MSHMDHSNANIALEYFINVPVIQDQCAALRAGQFWPPQ